MLKSRMETTDANLLVTFTENKDVEHTFESIAPLDRDDRVLAAWEFFEEKVGEGVTNGSTFF